jgi:DNA-binding transcriptional LysR family regulator
MDTLDLMRTFVAVADTQSFTGAGHRLGRSKALISKHIGELEERLGVRLINRTTRSVQVTEIGRAYYERARNLILDFEALEEATRSESGQPRGRLRITAPLTLGEHELMEMLKAFRARYPGLELDVVLADRIVDLVAEGFDVALRVTTLQDSSLIARKLCDVRILLCASPAYLARAGHPRSPRDLASHDCIVDTNIRWRDAWRFGPPENEEIVRVAPIVTVNSATAVHGAVVHGMGIGFMPEFVAAADLAAGRLVTLFEQETVHQLGVHIVYPHRLHLSAKVRAFIDFTADWYTPQPPWMRT